MDLGALEMSNARSGRKANSQFPFFLLDVMIEVNLLYFTFNPDSISDTHFNDRSTTNRSRHAFSFFSKCYEV